MDDIMKLRELSNWAFVQGKFPGGGDDGDKVFSFKMSKVGPCNSVDLVRNMQLLKPLKNAWIMFDRVKEVVGWTTMACQ